MGRIFRWLALGLLAIPVLFVATCSYTSFSPHLRLEPINVALMDAPLEIARRWRSVDVALTPDVLQVGEDQAAVMGHLKAAGYVLQGEYLPQSRMLDQAGVVLSLEERQRMFTQEQRYYAERGVTHVFERGGRARPACGEAFYVEIGFVDGALSRASGYSRWTCL